MLHYGTFYEKSACVEFLWLGTYYSTTILNVYPSVNIKLHMWSLVLESSELHTSRTKSTSLKILSRLDYMQFKLGILCVSHVLHTRILHIGLRLACTIISFCLVSYFTSNCKWNERWYMYLTIHRVHWFGFWYTYHIIAYKYLD